MRPLCRLPFLFIGTLLAMSLGHADTITLEDGRVIEGEIITPREADPISVRVREGSITAVFHYPQATIREIQQGPSERLQTIRKLRQQLQQTFGQAQPSAAAAWEIALEFRAMDEPLEFTAATRQVSEHFPDFPPARHALGQQLYDGEWLSEAEIKRRQGFLYYDGAWRSSEEIAHLQKIEEERLSLAEQQARVRDARRSRRSSDSYRPSSNAYFGYGYSRNSYCHSGSLHGHHYRRHHSGAIIGLDEVIRW